MPLKTGQSTCKIGHTDPVLLSAVKTWASSFRRPLRPLHLQALLQTPRLADSFGFAPISEVDDLVAQLVQEVPAAEEWGGGTHRLSPDSLHFGEADPVQTETITRRFHYLRSPRPDGNAYALSTGDGNVIAICVCSPLDVPRIRDLLVSNGRNSRNARVVSRVFACENAPRNSISYLLSRCAQEERRRGTSDLVTYVNPNLGFTGVSYRASGWTLLGDEPGTTYRYLDGRYITDRELHKRFGPLEDPEYRRLLGNRFAISIMPLDPLLIFHFPIG